LRFHEVFAWRALRPTPRVPEHRATGRETVQRTLAATPADISGSHVTVAARSSLGSAGVALALAEVAPSVVRRDTGMAPSSIPAKKCSVAGFGISESNRGKFQAFSGLVFHLILRGLGYRRNFGVRVGLFRFGSLGKQK